MQNLPNIVFVTIVVASLNIVHEPLVDRIGLPPIPDVFDDELYSLRLYAQVRSRDLQLASLVRKRNVPLGSAHGGRRRLVSFRPGLPDRLLCEV